jgi:hypothetical protein
MVEMAGEDLAALASEARARLERVVAALAS